MADTNIPTDPAEAVEVRLVDRTGAVTYVLTGYRTDRGTVGHSLVKPGSSVPHALSNLQTRGVFPGKAVAGWQHEFVAAASVGLYRVGLVR